jgi:hypothetical protein
MVGLKERKMCKRVTILSRLPTSAAREHLSDASHHNFIIVYMYIKLHGSLKAELETTIQSSGMRMVEEKNP